MSNPYFKFKQFTVWHDKCAMKVGTDGVLLGAWTPVATARTILDVGTGTGLIALMLAQRSPSQACITALEIDSEACLQAEENVSRSPWKNQIKVCQGDFKKMHFEDNFDLITSNPPYFANSLTCPDKSRTIARHAESLGYEELLRGVKMHLAEEGLFTVIIPNEAFEVMNGIAQEQGLYLMKQLCVLTKLGGIPKRRLLCFSKKQRDCQTDSLLIEQENHQYSNEYISLTKDYYLYM